MRQNHVSAFARSLAITLGLIWAAGVHAEPVSIDHNGLRLNGDLSIADGKSPADPAILLVHGTGAHHGMETISGVQQALLQQGLNVLAVTLSLGVSDRKGMMACDKAQNHRHTDAFQEIDAWLAYLRKSGVQRTILMGHSRGGNQVAWYAASGSPAEDISGIVLLAPATWDEARARSRFKERFKQDLGDLISKAKAAAPDASLKDVPFLSCPTATVTAGAFLNYYAGEPKRDTPALLGKIKLPVLVVAATEDAVVPDLAERLSKVALDHVTVSMVDGADHFFLDFFADDVAEAVSAFVEGGE